MPSNAGMFGLPDTPRANTTAQSSVKQMADHNKFEYKGNRQDLIDMGYEPCGNCQP